MSEREIPRPEPEPAKKPYATPGLVEYGPVEKLTRTGSQSTGDAAHMMMACL